MVLPRWTPLDFLPLEFYRPRITWEKSVLNLAPSPTAVDGETLAKLLVAASATLDSDLVAAKACIQQATDLLQARMQQARGTPVIQGGLAAWQRKRVAAYVEAHMASNIRANDLAQVAHVSLGHFFRTFRLTFGEPPLSYVAKRRVCRSQSLMLSSDAPLAQIALECGLSDQPHFTRVFRKIVGVTPGLWRRQFGNEAPQTSPAPLI
jgi:AraC family transcriptional regulator